MAASPLVLLVEPDPDTRELYELALGLDGVAVTSAATGEEAMTMARETHPNVVVMELRLPDTDGLGLATLLGRPEVGLRPQIVAMSADLTHFSEDIARRAGCAAFLPKPCLPELIVSEVRHSLR
jgi:CheY-like chemotaxis protein